MFTGVVVGIVKDNKDPEKMHRILVEIPEESTDGKIESYWCRVSSPMAGKDRGLVILPDVGTEVVLGFSYKSNSPYVLGAVYNGKEDKAEPYKNADGANDKRVFWSRSDHLVVFNDSSGGEQVGFGAQASSRLDVTSAPIHHVLDSSKMIITEFCEKDTNWEATKNISIKCKEFELDASNAVKIKGLNVLMKAGTKMEFSGGLY